MNGSYRCQTTGCQWRRWVGWHCPGPAEMKWSSLMTLVGCSGPAPCCCHSSYRTLCDGDNNTDKVSEYDGTEKNEQTCIQAIVCVCALQVFFRNRLFFSTHNFPFTLSYLQYVLLTNLSFEWRTCTVMSGFTSSLERNSSWFSVDLWLQQTSLTKNNKKKNHLMALLGV